MVVQCSRTYGLGTRLPWDPRWLIESLSDSTIYMAYYTVAHLLQGGSLTQGADNAVHVTAEQMTDEAWDCIFLGTTPSATCPVPAEALARLRNEFLYFYPLDLRVSGKDLVQNHLTYALYNHVALFPKEMWPRSFRANGHLLINSEKMSKSTGNFLTMADSVKLYTADGTRFALADAGDGLEDANFESTVANAAILRLYSDLEWTEATLKSLPTLRTDARLDRFADRVFLNDINHSIVAAREAFDKMMFKVALKTGYYELHAARDRYLLLVAGGDGVHRDLIVHFIKVQAILLSPFCPHICEHIWGLLGNTTSILDARWPTAGPVDLLLQRQGGYIDGTRHELAVRYQDALLRSKKRNEPVPKTCTVYVAQAYPEWQQRVLCELKATIDATPGINFEAKIEGTKKTVAEEVKAAIFAKIKDEPCITSLGKAVAKKFMPFVAETIARFIEVGPAVLELELPFNEMDVLKVRA
jgi:leucyl-tRNA synthetase